MEQAYYIHRRIVVIKYNIYNKGNAELFKKIINTYHVSEMIARLMVNRDVPFEEMGDYLEPDINKFGNPYLLTDVESAAEFTKATIDAGKKLRVIGDYDIDGIMSSYILVDGLSKIGANVDYQIPHRIEDGYGLNANIIRRAIDDGIDLIITCDNGVSAIDEIQLARDNGIDVIVTDHHEFMHDSSGKEIRPNANYVINPKREGDKYPFKNLCGAVVAWKFITVLFDKCNISTDTIDPIKKYIQYAAFATIGDVMELTGENRMIVKFGLDEMYHTDNIGLRCLIDKRIGVGKPISSYHIGFVLGPCINASGRLDTAAMSLQLLLEEDEKKANELSEELIELNEERKLMTDEGVEQAIGVAEGSMKDDKVLVIYVPKIHESVAGIVAGRIREKYSKPTIVLCDGDECVKGSGRSIEKYNMYEALHDNKELFIKFGGHPMAAGMSLDEGNVDALRRQLNEACELSEEDFADTRMIDMTMNPGNITIDKVKELELLEPFGTGNKKPLFATRDVKLIRIRRIGDGRFFKFDIATASGIVTALYFEDAKELENKIIEAFGEEEFNKALRGGSDKIIATIMYYPQINEFRGNREVQIVLSDVVLPTTS